MDIKNINKVFFLGIGGIGMSALARYFNANGATVFGYDKTKTKLCQQLENENINIHYQDDVKNIPENIDLVVYTPAIPSENNEFQYLQISGLPFLKRSKVLGLISDLYKTIAVAGTHGKTTTSSIIAHILNENEVKVTAFIGGICNNYNSNLILNDNSEVVVVEADEFDKSFLNLNPEISIITSMDADHLDIYGNTENLKLNFESFANKTKETGLLIHHNSLQFNDLNVKSICNYAYNSNSDFEAKNIRYRKNGVEFDLKTNSEIYSDFQMQLPGIHNIENATAAIAACSKYGLSFSQIKKALATYKGVERRFDIKLNQKRVYIDDYAHHPQELKATISAAKNMYKDEEITGIFQPHLYSRTRDFAEEFAKSLELLDNIILIDIYPAREKPIEGITSEYLLTLINHKQKYYVKNEDLLDFIYKLKPRVLLTLGAGNIDKFVNPIYKLMSKL
jgi:UDP-N-acetylmuramate--alanine ligase